MEKANNHGSSVVPSAPKSAGSSTYSGRGQNTLREVLVSVWSSVLNMEKIGIQDDFFELGGDSILATQMISRLREMFQVDLPAVAIFDAPTVEKLAQFMIEHELRPGLTEKTALLLKQIEGMSEEEVARRLDSKRVSLP